MGTAQANALKDLYDSFTSRMVANPDMDVAGLRDMLHSLSVLAAEPTGVTYADVDAGGVPAILATPLDARPDYAIVYSHGGGCVTGSADSHRKLAAHLAKAAGTHALVVDYRLAPEHPFPAQIEDLVVAHGWLRANGYAREHTATAGDSAGANLAITSVLKLRELGEPLPAAIVAISPWWTWNTSARPWRATPTAMPSSLAGSARCAPRFTWARRLATSRWPTRCMPTWPGCRRCMCAPATPRPCWTMPSGSPTARGRSGLM